MHLSRRHFLRKLGLNGLMVFLSRYGFVSPAWAGEEALYLRNEELPVIKTSYPGNILIDGRFVNEDRSYVNNSFGKIFNWMISANPQKKEKEADTFKLKTIKLPPLNTIDRDCIIWLGHASFLIRIDGKWLLTDPCLTHPPTQERLAELPVPIEKIQPLDYLLLSHGHYDHLDRATIETLPARGVKALLPLKMAELIRSMNKFLDTQESGWYQQFNINESFKIYFLPAQHWYLRVPWDRNKILWGSFLIEKNGVKIYFAGDTAYAGHFNEIYKLFGTIDYCLMPVGAYKPPYIMKNNHTNPEEAVMGFNELHGKVFIPMHYGTFDLADEPLGEPVRWLQKLNEEKKINGELKIPDVGEILYI
ncbi:MBL fold metallo-hydrolase [bacterium]|nr:MBL fold metallo-hydrolase [bacterium]